LHLALFVTTGREMTSRVLTGFGKRPIRWTSKSPKNPCAFALISRTDST
jgi:hypothetical protein